jgi:uncharacterized protein YqjF (DUF2071 family)
LQTDLKRFSWSGIKETSMIDRLQPTRRPQGRAKGYQSWRELLFLHWKVSVEALRQLVPSVLELDLYDNTAFVGLVPFAMHSVRPAWVPAPCGFDFLETNVRTYVHHQGRPGVYFFSLDAASRLAVWTARRFWGLPYHFAEMDQRTENEVVHYRSRRSHSNAELQVSYRVGGSCGPSPPDSAEFFLLERYLLFVDHRDMLWQGQVHHRPYPASRAELVSVDENLMEAAGIPLAQAPPDFVHYSSGVDVEIFPLKAVASLR